MALDDYLKIFSALGLLVMLGILLFSQENIDKDWLEYLKNEEHEMIKYSSYEDFLKHKLREQEQNTPKYIVVISKIAKVSMIVACGYSILIIIKLIFF